MWEFLRNIKDFLSLNHRSLLIVALVCWVIIIIPMSTWESYEIDILYMQIKPWAFFIGVVSTTWFIGALVYDLFVLIKSLGMKKIESIQLSKQQERVIKKTSRVEREILARYISEDTTTIAFDFRDGIINGLVSKGILYRSSQASNPFSFDFDCNIQPWAWKYLQDNPELLDEVEQNKKGRHQLW